MNNTPIAQQFMKYSQSGRDNVQYVYNGRTYKVTKEWIEQRLQQLESHKK